jgi:putative Holliday junction resolvase
VIAIDFGERSVGLASADALRIALAPLAGLRTEGREELLLEHLRRLAEERHVSTFLVGNPLHLDGRAGPRTRAVQAFVARLRARFPGVEVVLFDERLTTKEAESRLAEQGVRGRRAAPHKDSWSALVLLEDWVRSGEPRAAGGAPPGLC